MSALAGSKSLTGALAFAAGVPLAVGVLWLILEGPGRDTAWRRYVEHPVEQTEVVLFCFAPSALVVKVFAYLRQRSAITHDLLPHWQGQACPAQEAKSLQTHLNRQPGWVQASWLGRRVAGVLDFVHGRGSANDLDDQLRALADTDALAQENSFSLLRLIIWAIPILGFLGTVIGITGAIAGVTPETLEQSLSGVTQGLSTAFDATALALFLTMVLMILSFVVERLEQNLLAQVDAYVDTELAHRFERTAPESSPMIEGLRQGSQVILRAAEELVAKQAVLWGQSLEQIERRWSQEAPKLFDHMQRGLQQALEETLTRHAQHLQRTEDKFLARTQTLLEGLSVAAEKLRLQTAALKQLQENEAHLARLQEALNQNLAAVASTGTFDQAVQSLTAAIHLLTARVGPTTAPWLTNKPAA